VLHYFLVVLRLHLIEFIHLPLQHSQGFTKTLKIYGPAVSGSVLMSHKIAYFFVVYSYYPSLFVV
jgi:hypothetical protein